MPICLSEETVRELLELPFLECVHQMLNLIFQGELRKGNLDLGVGRDPIRLTKLAHKAYVGECWHSASGSFSESVNLAAELLGKENGTAECGWRKIGITAAFLCGILGRMLRSGAADWKTGVHFSAMAEDFSLLMSAWYVRSWGFPIRKILCCATEDDGIWDLFHGGIFETDGFVPMELERLLYHCAGRVEAERFSDCRRLGMQYSIDEELRQRLCEEMQVYVIGENRIESTVSGMYRSGGYVLPPKAAGAFAAAMDHRSGTGDKGTVLVLAENSPAWDAGEISRALRMTEQKFLAGWNNR